MLYGATSRQLLTGLFSHQPTHTAPEPSRHKHTRRFFGVCHFFSFFFFPLARLCVISPLFRPLSWELHSGTIVLRHTFLTQTPCHFVDRQTDMTTNYLPHAIKEAVCENVEGGVEMRSRNGFRKALGQDTSFCLGRQPQSVYQCRLSIEKPREVAKKDNVIL